MPQLTLNADWPEIAALIRIELALSFDSRLGAQLYLADVLHACISLVATGPALIRSAVQGLLVNTVHSLSKDPGVDAVKLRVIQDTLTGPEAERIFELTPPSNTDVAKGLAWDVSDSGAELVRLMAEVIDAGAPTVGTSTPTHTLTPGCSSVFMTQTQRTPGERGGRACRPPTASSTRPPCNRERTLSSAA